MKFKVGDKVRIHGVTDLRSSYNGKEVTITGVNTNRVTNFKRNITHYSVGEVYVFWEDELVPATVSTQKIVITSDGKETLARLYDGGKVVKTATAKCSPNDTFDFKTGAMLAFERLMNEVKKPLTFRDKLKQEHPEYVDERWGGGCKGCPSTYDYEKKYHCGDGCYSEDKCTKCWDREIPEDKPKYYNGKVVCIKEGIDLTVGKVYEFVDGKLLDNAGADRPCPGDPRERVKNFEDSGWAREKFIPLVE